MPAENFTAGKQETVRNKSIYILSPPRLRWDENGEVAVENFFQNRRNADLPSPFTPKNGLLFSRFCKFAARNFVS